MLEHRGGILDAPVCANLMPPSTVNRSVSAGGDVSFSGSPATFRWALSKKAGPGETALAPSTAYHAQGSALSARDKAMKKTDDPTHKFPALKAYILLWSNRQSSNKIYSRKTAPGGCLQFEAWWWGKEPRGGRHVLAAWKRERSKPCRSLGKVLQGNREQMRAAGSTSESQRPCHTASKKEAIRSQVTDLRAGNLEDFAGHCGSPAPPPPSPTQRDDTPGENSYFFFFKCNPGENSDQKDNIISYASL